MWYGVSELPSADPSFVSAANERLQSVSRKTIVVIGSIYMAWQLVVTASFTSNWVLKTAPITLIVMLVCGFTLHLLPKRFPASQAIWQLGLATAITLAIGIFQQPAIALLYALLPFMAAVGMGWGPGLLVECLVVALVYWITHWSWMPSVPTTYPLVIITGGLLTGLLGLITSSTLLTGIQWYHSISVRARQEVEETRDQLAEFKQIQDDLMLANRELARLSDRLKAMYRVAEESRRAKEEFVSNVSHELRTPLNMIIGFSEMITQSPQTYGSELPPALMADVAAIRRNSEHLARLVDDVLDLSQIEAGRMSLIREFVSPSQIIEEAALTVRPLFESKGLYLEIETSPDLPEILCDSTRIRQVLINILSNAGRFTEQGGVRIKAWRETSNVAVSVTDSGPGIALEDQSRLFEPFQQLDSSIRRRHGGSGLGLSISRQFVEMHGGKMRLASQVGVGTTITFTLPVEMPTSRALDASSGRGYNPYAQYEMRARRSKAPVPQVVPRFVILEEGKTLERLFTRFADHVEVVSVQDDEEAALELSRSPAQALIVNRPLLDSMSPSADLLSKLPYGTPCIACWVPGESEAADRLGVVRYLVKPITRDVLLSTLQGMGESVESVLLVDDNPEVLQLFTRALLSTDKSYHVLQADNGRRALTLLRERQPDVMLLDLIMPEMDGFAVLREKSLDPTIRDIPVVTISARDPAREPLVSDMLNLTRTGGLSIREVLACIQAISGVLNPSLKSDRREQPESPGA